MKVTITLMVMCFLISETQSANSFSNGSGMKSIFSFAGTLGIEIPEECKSLMSELGDEIAARVYDQWLVPICKSSKCKPIHKELKQYWHQVRQTAEMIVDKIATLTTPSFNFRKLPGKCAKFQSILAWSNLWKEARPVVKKCALAYGSPGQKEVDKVNICSASEKDFKQTADCIKNEGTPIVLTKYMGQAMAAVPCAQELIETYCNDKHMRVWLDYNTKTALTDRSTYPGKNPFTYVEDFFKKNDCKAKPFVQNEPGEA